MQISDVEYYRGDGALVFTLLNDALAGHYRLPTPLTEEPRFILRDGDLIPPGSPAEAELLAELQVWLNTEVTDDLCPVLSTLDSLPDWHTLPADHHFAVTCHYIHLVVLSLAPRHRPPLS